MKILFCFLISILPLYSMDPNNFRDSPRRTHRPPLERQESELDMNHQRDKAPTPPVVELPSAPELEPDRHDSQAHTEFKRLKVKLVAVTAIVTALISGGVTLYIALRNCK